MPKPPHDSRHSGIEPDDDLPDDWESHGDRPVTRREMVAYVTQMYRPVMAGIGRLEREAAASRLEREARRLRERQERDERAARMSETVREKMQSESELIKAQAAALQRPPTPAQSHAPASDPEIKQPVYKRTAVIVAIVGAIATVATVAISAYFSQQQHPRGAIVAPPAQGPHP